MLAFLLTETYPQIYINAKNIAKKPAIAKELINVTYIHIQQKNKEIPQTPEEFIKYYTKYMHFMFIGKYSEMNTFRLSQYIEGEIVDVSENFNPSVQKEEDEQIKKIAIFKKSLFPHEKELFELVIEKGVSVRKIAKLLSKETGYDISHVLIFRLVTQLKQKINAGLN